MTAREIAKKWYKLNAEYYEDLSKGICPDDTRAQLDYFLLCEIPSYLREDITLYDQLPEDLRNHDDVINALTDIMFNRVNTKSFWYKEQVNKCWKEYNKEEKRVKRMQTFIPECVELNTRTK